MRNPFRRSPVRTAEDAAAIRAVIFIARASAASHVLVSRLAGLDDLLIISRAQEAADEVDGHPDKKRGAQMLAREIARLIHNQPSEGEPPL
ncbi:hypothetical protein SPF06_00920 [Sinomonas sp. JGH33]|uniref:Uncharacterized protein n=1 Tax=Sinomonas terricola TaxID=3110330 RepID=A0ABU5T0T9_9MICC|nr:hypothetical protein [Sinomonas sp. JGH33]MEA5453272.1 hypothetical protein [Sinomonas sp. JGH33]